MKGRVEKQSQLTTYFSYHHHERRCNKADKKKTFQITRRESGGIGGAYNEI